MDVILKFFKFGAVGFIGLIIDFGMTYLLKEKAGINKFLANTIGFAVAVVNNYMLNKYWTFASVNPHYVREFSSFLLISIMGLLLNNGLLYLLHEKWKMPFYVAKTCSIGMVVIWNFSMNYLITFG